MKKIISFVGCFIYFALFTPTAFAGEAVGNVTATGIFSNNLVAIFMTGSNDMAFCAGQPGWFGFNMQDVAAKGMYATILSAKTTDSTLKIVGTGACTVWPNREDVKYVEIQ